MNDAIDIAAVAAIGAIGQPLRRKEDQRLLTGKGRFTDDFNMAEQAYAVMVRSPYPHARMVRVDGTGLWGIGASPSARQSAPPNTPKTPGIRFACDPSM